MLLVSKAGSCEEVGVELELESVFHLCEGREAIALPRSIRESLRKPRLGGVVVDAGVGQDQGATPCWTIQETGDFNGDGMSDILWRNTDGDVAIWLMNGLTPISQTDIGNVPTSWTIQGANAD